MSDFLPTKEQSDRLTAILAELKGQKGALMPALQRAQDIFGYLPKLVLSTIGRELGYTLEEVYGVCTFYSQFRLKPRGKHCIGVCLGTACYVKGSGKILDEFKSELGVEAGDTTADGKYTLEATRCIGCCGLAPVITVDDEVFGKLTEEDVIQILEKYN